MNEEALFAAALEKAKGLSNKMPDDVMLYGFLTDANVELGNYNDAEKAAQLFNLTGRRSRSLADCMIAAVAIRSGAKMATINAAHFQPFLAHGLVLA